MAKSRKDDRPEKQVFHLTGSELQTIIDRHGRDAVRIGIDGRTDLVEVDPALVEEARRLPTEPETEAQSEERRDEGIEVERPDLKDEE